MRKDYKTGSKSKLLTIVETESKIEGKTSPMAKIKRDSAMAKTIRPIVWGNLRMRKLIIEKKDRQLAGFSVPAHALFLKKIDYDWDKILLNG